MVGVNMHHDGRPELLVFGSDWNRDGIPDALQTSAFPISYELPAGIPASASFARALSPMRHITAGREMVDLAKRVAQIELDFIRPIGDLSDRLTKIEEQCVRPMANLVGRLVMVEEQLIKPIGDLTERVASVEESWRIELSEDRKERERLVQDFREEHRVREESLEGMRSRIEANQAVLIESATEDKGLMEAVQRDLASLHSRHALVLAEFTKSKSDTSFAAGAQSTLQEFVTTVLVRFEALREKTETTLASVVEQSDNAASGRNLGLHADSDSSAIAGLAKVEDVVGELCNRVVQLETTWEQVLVELKSSLQEERQSRQKETDGIVDSLAERLSSTAAESSRRIDQQDERLDDISRLLCRFNKHHHQMEDLTPDLDRRGSLSMPRVRADLVEAALATEGCDLEAQKRRLTLMREALTPPHSTNGNGQRRQTSPHAREALGIGRGPASPTTGRSEI